MPLHALMLHKHAIFRTLLPWLLLSSDGSCAVDDVAVVRSALLCAAPVPLLVVVPDCLPIGC